IFGVTSVSTYGRPLRMYEYAKSAAARGLRVIIAGVGWSAHLPGTVASITHLPVIEVPVKSYKPIDGRDSVLAILQMPNGIPAATGALNAAKNAGILAAQILATASDEITKSLLAVKADLEAKVEEPAQEIENMGF